jgi:hypothetical protein
MSGSTSRENGCERCCNPRSFPTRQPRQLCLLCNKAAKSSNSVEFGIVFSKRTALRMQALAPRSGPPSMIARLVCSGGMMKRRPSTAPRDLSCSGFVRPKPGRGQNGTNASLWQRIKTSGQACELHCSAFGQKISRSGFLSIHCSGFIWPKWSRSDRLPLNTFSPRS